MEEEVWFRSGEVGSSVPVYVLQGFLDGQRVFAEDALNEAIEVENTHPEWAEFLFGIAQTRDELQRQLTAMLVEMGAPVVCNSDIEEVCPITDEVDFAVVQTAADTVRKAVAAANEVLENTLPQNNPDKERQVVAQIEGFAEDFYKSLEYNGFSLTPRQ